MFPTVNGRASPAGDSLVTTIGRMMGISFTYERIKRAAEVVRVRVKDHSKEKIVDLRDFPQLTDMFAGWIGLTPDDDLLLLRDRSLQEIYALDLEFH